MFLCITCKFRHCAFEYKNMIILKHHIYSAHNKVDIVFNDKNPHSKSTLYDTSTQPDNTFRNHNRIISAKKIESYCVTCGQTTYTNSTSKLIKQLYIKHHIHIIQV